MAFETYYSPTPGYTGSYSKLSVGPTDDTKEKERLELLAKIEAERKRVASEFCKPLGLSNDHLYQIGGFNFIWGTMQTPQGTLNLSGKNNSKNLPLEIKSLSPSTKAQFLSNLTLLLTTTPVPPELNRKDLSVVVLENSKYTLRLHYATLTLLKWCATVIKNANGANMQWLPIIQDLIWLAWGWKKPVPVKKAKSTKKKSLKANRNPFDEAIDRDLWIRRGAPLRAVRLDDGIAEDQGPRGGDRLGVRNGRVERINDVGDVVLDGAVNNAAVNNIAWFPRNMDELRHAAPHMNPPDVIEHARRIQRERLDEIPAPIAPGPGILEAIQNEDMDRQDQAMQDMQAGADLFGDIPEEENHGDIDF
jgi:hypothetical protein